MKIEVAIAIAAVWYIYRAIAKARKKKQSELQRGGQNTNISPNPTQEFVDLATIESRAMQMAQERETHFLDQPVEDARPASITDPFLEATSMETNAGHYDETSLVAEYEETHSRGKTVAHHKHQLFDAQKDRHKAAKHKQQHQAKGTAKTRKAEQMAANATGRAQRKGQTTHPLASALAGKGGLKRAFLMAEILKRPEW